MCTADNIKAEKLNGEISAVVKKTSPGRKAVDVGAVRGLSALSVMGADSVIQQLIYIHGTVCELAVKWRPLFYLFKSLTLSPSSSPQLKMSLAFSTTF